MNVHDAAMRLIRGRNTPSSDPAFIAAYLEREVGTMPPVVENAIKAAIAREVARDAH